MDSAITGSILRKLVLGVPGMERWEEVEEFFPDTQEEIRLDWQLPGIACSAVGGRFGAVFPAMAAIACVQVSIIMVDDMLDEEPDGAHHRIGIGRTANLALALQAAGAVLIENCQASPAGKAAAAYALNRMALATASGQEMDVRNLSGEENYWQVVRAKSTPFYGTGLEIGALLGGASPEMAQVMYNVGVLFGEAIQIYDDLEDAFQSPANSDWAQGRNNLALLYGLTADYPAKEEFLHYKQLADDLSSLHKAQQLLIGSGAVAYCAFQLLQRHTAVQRSLHSVSLRRQERMDHLLKMQLAPFTEFVREIDEKLADLIQEEISHTEP
ncbi:MAG: polyprenyl synthetase family protein [Caldilineaceae bacterium]|nr:polyprenyl synthetase family protein [Caldilineaceae bacterium]